MTTTYTGSCKVLIGNSSSLRIPAIGTSVISTSSIQLLLNHMLYTPCVTKTLVSVSHFAKESQVYFEFHASYCLVKDSISHKVILKGFESNGLYKPDLSNFISIGL